jgi:hypothetical protein
MLVTIADIAKLVSAVAVFVAIADIAKLVSAVAVFVAIADIAKLVSAVAVFVAIADIAKLMTSYHSVSLVISLEMNLWPITLCNSRLTRYRRNRPKPQRRGSKLALHRPHRAVK